MLAATFRFGGIAKIVARWREKVQVEIQGWLGVAASPVATSATVTRHGRVPNAIGIGAPSRPQPEWVTGNSNGYVLEKSTMR